MRGAAIALWIVAGAASPAAAQEAAPDADAEARALFESGREAFDAGRLEVALEKFRRAYELSARPALLYNIAMSHDRLRDDRAAIEWFERYLAESPDAPNRESVERRLELLRGQVGAGQREVALADEGLSPWPFVVLGGAVVLGVAAGVFWALANDADADLAAGCSGSCTRADIDDSGGPTFVTLTNVLAIAALLAAATGSVMLGIDLTSDAGSADGASASRRLAPLPGLGGSF